MSTIGLCGVQMNDESHLPMTEQSLLFRLRMRAHIRRQIPNRKAVEEGTPDRIADLLEEAAAEIDELLSRIDELEDIARWGH
jgi:hypothetical protein